MPGHSALSSAYENDSGHWQHQVLPAHLTIPQNEYGDLRITAVYAEESYQIYLDSNGGNGFTSMGYNFAAESQEITLPTPEKDGFIFVEWQITSNTTPASAIDGLKVVEKLVK